jgi:histone-binding protein RBBP4
MTEIDLAGAAWQHWKSDTVPLNYDWIINRNMDWPSSSVRWGPILKARPDHVSQRLYLSERTGDTEYLNTLVLAQVVVPRPGFSNSEPLRDFGNEGGSTCGNTGQFHVDKRIVHPGEVNSIRALHVPGFVATHSDTSTVYVWDTNVLPNSVATRKRKTNIETAQCPEPTVSLVGHEDIAQLAALDCSINAAVVLSGGQDHLVLMWAIENVDHAAGAGTVLHPTARFAGHTDVVEAVACHPDQQEECCSGGDDRLLIFWDSRQPTMPTTVVRGLHNGDINCLSWNAIDTRLVATGCSDGAVQVFDRRKLSQPLRRFGSCESGASVHGPPAVFSVEWMPNSNRVLGSGSEDGKVLLWDLEAAQASAPVVFVHPGHCLQVLDLCCNPSSPNTMASLSEPENGGKLQLWRISELRSSAAIFSASASVARSELDKPAPVVKRQRTP